MFQLYFELLGTPYFTKCPHQFTIPSSIYYDDHDPKCLICTLSCYGIFIRPTSVIRLSPLGGFLMRVTIKDVAKLAGVAPSTVTRHPK